MEKAIGAVAVILALTVLLFFIFGAIGHSIGGAAWAPEHVVAALKDTILAIVAGLIGFISGAGNALKGKKEGSDGSE